MILNMITEITIVSLSFVIVLLLAIMYRNSQKTKENSYKKYIEDHFDEIDARINNLIVDVNDKIESTEHSLNKAILETHNDCNDNILAVDRDFSDKVREIENDFDHKINSNYHCQSDIYNYIDKRFADLNKNRIDEIIDVFDEINNSTESTKSCCMKNKK